MALPHIVDSADLTKHVRFRAQYTPAASFNPQMKQAIGESDSILYGLEVTGPDGGPFTVHPGAFITNRTIVEITEPQTIDAPSGLAAPFVLYAFTANEKDSEDTVFNYAEDQLIQPGYVPLAEFDGIGLKAVPRSLSNYSVDQSAQGGIRERVVTTTSGGETSFSNLDLPFKLTRGSNLWVFRDGRKVAFEQTGSSPAAGWNFTTRNQINLVGGPVVAAEEEWEFILDDNIVFQEPFVGNDSQTTFSLTYGEYNPGSGNLLVFLEGVLQRPGVDYTEDNSTDITFGTAPGVDEIVELVKHRGVIFSEENDATSGQTDFQMDLYRIRATRFGVFVFQNGLKLLADEDYTETGLEQITLTSGAVSGDRVDIYNLRQSMPVIRQRRLSELKNMTIPLEQAIIDPDGNRADSPDRTAPFIASTEVDSKIGTAIDALDFQTTRDEFEPGRVFAKDPGSSNTITVTADPSFRFGNEFRSWSNTDINLEAQFGPLPATQRQWVLVHVNTSGLPVAITGGASASPTIPNMEGRAPLALVDLGPDGTFIDDDDVYDMRHPAQHLTSEVLKAIVGANSPSSGNPFATQNDVSGITFGGLSLATDDGDFSVSLDDTVVAVNGGIGSGTGSPVGLGSGPIKVPAGSFSSVAVIIYGASFNINTKDSNQEIQIPLIIDGTPVPDRDLVGFLKDFTGDAFTSDGRWKGSDVKIHIKDSGLGSDWQVDFGQALSRATSDEITYRWIMVLGT